MFTKERLQTLYSSYYSQSITVSSKPIFTRNRHSCQGQGIGVRLLQNWESWAKTQNQNDVVLGVWSENKDAQRFYSRYGYKKISEYKLSVGDVQDTDYIYHKTL